MATRGNALPCKKFFPHFSSKKGSVNPIPKFGYDQMDISYRNVLLKGIQHARMLSA